MDTEDEMSRENRILLISALCVSLIWGGVAEAGQIYISGQDSDDFGHVTVAFGSQLLNFVGTGNTNGGSGILILGGDTTGTSRDIIDTWNVVPFVLTQATDAVAIAAQSFSAFAGILIPSAVVQTSGGISQAELDAINARAIDIANFVNGGGNLMAFTEAGLTNAFGWFPLGSLSIVNDNYLPVAQTPELASAGFTATDAEISGDLYHNVFTGPPGFFGLNVLATNADSFSPTLGEAAILGGGATTQICGVPGGPPCGVPEPATLILLGVGAIGLGAARSWRRRK
jgi:hypothetical protein